jgi:coupling of ubiquitin conjugation to ER degradation protein 1
MPASGTPRTNASAQTKAPTHQDLITRYRLQDKISGALASDVRAGSNEPQKRPAWSQNKAERQQLFQKRREEMILAARRKMEDKDRAVKT